MPAADVTIDRREVKNVRVRVSEDGSVLLIVPKNYTAAQVDSMLARKASWIDDKRKFFAKRKNIRHKLSPNELRLFGETFRSVVRPELRNRTEIDFRSRVVVTGLDLADVEIRTRWVRRVSKHYLEKRVVELCSIHGFSYNRLFVKSPGKRWGSCSSRKNISLNWRLIEAPKNVSDYVILHELLHTRIMKHDHRFWSHLRAICPCALAAQKWLEVNRPACDSM